MVLLLGACGSGSPQPPPRVYATACRLAGTVGVPPSSVKLTRVLSGATLRLPVQLLAARDGTGRSFVVEKAGTIQVADKLSEGGGARLWLDLTDRVASDASEMGLLSMAPHPDFSRNGRFYVNYTRRLNGKMQTVISRFVVPSPPLGAPDRTTERVLLVIDQPYENHNGGQIAFGPDGLLYIGMGDGGSGGDPQNNAQNKQSLLGKILRIDVNVPDGTPYRIPADNPFQSAAEQAAGTRPEIWALGLRNPWRFSFDPVDGALWAGDVGQDTEEEVDVVVRGGNYGWRLTEGNRCYNPQNCSFDGLIRPVHSYPRSDGKSISGGVVYRGQALPGLYGAYLFGDYGSGNLWALSRGADGTYSRTTLAEGQTGVVAFGAGPDGEVHVVDINRSQLFRMDPSAPGATGQSGWPAKLSETGCFSDLRARTLVAGALRYSVNAPLWSDGAEKERALLLPDGGVIDIPEGDAEGRWRLPRGSVLVKTFLFGGRPLETRFLLQDGEDLWRGVTYRWNAAGDDGDLLLNGATEDLGGQVWQYPSRSDCVTCHTRAAGFVLGVTTPQLSAVSAMRLPLSRSRSAAAMPKPRATAE